ncbi:MAG TPA: matrixin family metalloprotease [Gemmatimonadaceae bacterium]|nr:matrixin family metalloprotease [Gemmatimonadaceae bacterium]
MPERRAHVGRPVVLVWMKRTDFMLMATVVAMGGWIAVQADAVRHGSVSQTQQSAAAIVDVPRANAHDDGDASTPTGVVSASRPHDAAPARDLSDIRRRIAEGENGTYIGDILAQRDSALARWPERLVDPLRVWIQAGDSIPDWKPEFVDQTRDAFVTWQNTGVPVAFVFTRDSSSADVHVTWRDHFDEQISGKTMWARDENWWIVDANITIALHHNHGEPLDASAVRAIALHEVGHLLGLDHASDTTNIMTARVRVRDLSNADRATMRLLYTLPPGSVK